MLKKEDGLLSVFPYIQKCPQLFGKYAFSFEIEGITYYFKDTTYMFEELIVNEIYKMLEISCVDYELVKLWNEYYVMSPSFRKEGRFYLTGYDILSEYFANLNENDLKDLGINYDVDGIYGVNNLENIWLALSERNFNAEDIRNILLELIKIYSMQIILMDSDYHYYNWEVEVDQNGRASLAPKFDNGGCFSVEKSHMIMGVDAEDTFNNFKKSLSKFLSYSDCEDSKIFYDLFEKCNIDLLKQAINNVKEKYGKHYGLIYKSKNENVIIERFESHYKAINDMLDGLRMKK